MEPIQLSPLGCWGLDARSHRVVLRILNCE
jgi:hypothetical protein